MPEAETPSVRPSRSPTPSAWKTWSLAVGLMFLLVSSSCAGDGSSGGSAASGDTADVGTYSGYVVDPPNEVAAVTVPVADPPDGNGPESFEFSAAPGGLNLIYFGYTFCPDVCPTTMSDVRRVLAALPEDEADRIGVAVVTIDPDRDTAEVLTRYVHNFVDDGVALRPDDDAQLRAAADAFGANYEIRTNDAGEIEVSHTGELYAVDDSGTVVMQWPFGTSHESITRDVRSLLAEVDPPA